jgi:SAM-dependent methyltransferase
MPKQGEIDYVSKLAAHEVAHAFAKPFSDPRCGQYLMDLGLVLSLLPPPPARLLDLGVGPGWTSILFARRGYDVVGVDVAPAMIELARANRARCGDDLRLDFAVADYESLDWQDKFDAVVFYDALHHAEDEAAALATVFRALRPGGVCITVEPGARHADDPGAHAARARFGVTEKSMPPAHIIAVAQRLGFRKFEVYERPTPHLLEVVPDAALWRMFRRALRALLKDSWRSFVQRRQSLAGSHVVVMRAGPYEKSWRPL